MAGRNEVSDLVSTLLDGIAGRMEDVAEQAGVSYSALYSWATGRRRPGRDNLRRLGSLARERAQALEALADQLTAAARDGDGNGGDGGEDQEDHTGAAAA